MIYQFINSNKKLNDHIITHIQIYEKFNNVVPLPQLNLNEKNNNKLPIKKYKPLTYYRCSDKELGKVTKNIFDNNIIKKSNENWDIYVPCGYNLVEDELKKIKIKTPGKKIIFGLNGCDTIVSKNKIWETLLNCYGRKHASELMPESFVLGNKEHMLAFSQQFDKKQNTIYILKKNVQRKEGLKLTKKYSDIMTAYSEGYKVVQKYKTDLYLINNRKVNLRIYVLIIIKNGEIGFYVSKLGKCIYTNKEYNDNELDFETNITSYNLDMSVYEKNPRDFNQLKKYISKKNNEQDAAILFRNIDTLMKEVSICLSKNFYQSDNIKGHVTFQLFGADVIFDTQMRPFLLEMNKGPDMSARDIIDDGMKTRVQSDMFKLVDVLPCSENYNNVFYNVFRGPL
jgi:tubulin polyglutamylase TTLL9